MLGLLKYAYHNYCQEKTLKSEPINKKGFSPEKKEIKERILALKDKFGIKNLRRGGRLAKKLEVHASVITRLIDEISLPTFENLKSICKNAGVSADWLIFGDAWELKTSERKAEDYLAPTYSEGDLQALAQITLEADNFLKNSRLQISPERKYYWLQLNYEYWFTNREKPNETVLKENLNLSLGLLQRHKSD
jgi:plasmid maintenance system antidote protein VapI